MMKRTALRFINTSLASVAGLTLGAGLMTGRPFDAPPRAPSARYSPHAQEAQEKSFKDGKVDYKGVAFTYDASRFSEVKASIRPSSYDSRYEIKQPAPEHIVFVFVERNPARPASFIVPEIRVYPAAGFVGEGKTLAALRRMLQKQPVGFVSDVPQLPQPAGSEALHAHVKYLDFKNGKVIGYVTQGQQDEGPINNQSLSYEFLGLTADGRHYVSASFPVAAPFLPDDRDAATLGPIAYPSCYSCPEHRKFLRQYRSYAKGVERKLKRLPPAQFEPALPTIEALIRSLEIRD